MPDVVNPPTSPFHRRVSRHEILSAPFDFSTRRGCPGWRVASRARECAEHLRRLRLHPFHELALTRDRQRRARAGNGYPSPHAVAPGRTCAGPSADARSGGTVARAPLVVYMGRCRVGLSVHAGLDQRSRCPPRVASPDLRARPDQLPDLLEAAVTSSGSLVGSPLADPRPGRPLVRLPRRRRPLPH